MYGIEYRWNFVKIDNTSLERVKVRCSNIIESTADHTAVKFSIVKVLLRFFMSRGREEW